MRIALFAPYLPAPAHSGGRIRIHRLALALGALGEIELFAYAGRRELAEAGDRPELALYSRTCVAPSAFVGPPLCTPMRVRRMPGALLEAFRARHASVPFDVAVVEHCYAARVSKLFAGLPWVLDEHNVESEYLKARLLSSHGHLPPLLSREHRLLELWERRIWQSAGEVVCVAQSDADRVREVLGREPELVPNGVAVDEVRFVSPSARRGNAILFVGLMDHGPNVRAAERLAREVLPEVQKGEPSAHLILCGANPDRTVAGLSARDVEVTGRVESTGPYLERAAVYANALQHGSGTSLKVLEAFASGLPVVSTAVGVRGFPVSSGTHFLGAETSGEFAARILECLRDRARRDTGAEQARALAGEYDWRVLGPRFAEIVRRVAVGERASYARPSSVE
jgi:glycosyltransferase involved in cell wall biosynthesis